MEVPPRLLKKHGHFVFLLPWLCHKSNGSLTATFLILLVQLLRAGECFYFSYNTRDGELWWWPINSIFSPSPMGKERLMGIRDLGLFVLKDSKEMFLKISYCLEYGCSLWKVHTNWNTWVIFKWVTEIKDLKKVMWLALVGYVSGFKRTGWPGGNNSSLEHWVFTCQMDNKIPIYLASFSHYSYNLKSKLLFSTGKWR